MFTDMVGYSALAQRNEALALELLEEHRCVLRHALVTRAGREVRTTGDGFLIEFPSALAAVQCAIEIQEALHHRNLANPEERHVYIRIGIHVGDVVSSGDDIHGDGVNIGARLEPLAAPGGICVSEDVARQVRNKLPHPLVTLGPSELKHIELPVVICRVVLPWEQESAATVAVPGRPRKKFALLPSMVALLVVISGTLFWVRRSHGPPDVTLSARIPGQKSIAVLPFDNFSAEKDTDYLSDGLTEEITTALSRISGLKVAARGSAFAFKGKREDVRKVSEVLQVATVLEGSVRKAGNKIRVTAQLIKAADGYHIWSENYDRDVDNLLAVQSDIARQIADKLRLELSGAEQEQLAARPTTSPEAHELYLKGLYWWNKRNKGSLEKAVELFTQALVKDPRYSLAQAGLAMCFAVFPQYAGSPPKEFYAKAKAAAEKTLELDRSLPEAHAVLGKIRHGEYNWSGSEEEYQRAIKLNPNYATAHHWYSLLLTTRERLDEAMAEIRRAHELDPLSLVIQANLGVYLYYQDKDDGALQEIKHGLDLDPEFAPLLWGLGVIHLKKGKLQDALAAFEKAQASAGDGFYALGYLGHTLARLGKKAEATRTLAQLEEFTKQGYAAQLQKALVHLGLDDKDRTFEFLEKARLESEDISSFKADPIWARLRADPRYRQLLQKINLAN